MAEDERKSYRILETYDQIVRGGGINKQEWAFKTGITEKTVQRDLSEIRDYLELKGLGSLQYNKKDKRHRLKLGDREINPDQDMFAICKVLMDARAFCKEELEEILEFLLNLTGNRKVIEKAIRNERYEYKELQNHKPLLEKLWSFGEHIRKQEVLEVDYKRQDGKIKSYRINPLGLLFNEYYFYLVAEKNNIENTEEDPSRIFRLDRFLNYEAVKGAYFKIDNETRFQEGIFREQIQFMYAGKLETISFEFSGPSLEAVRDRLPTAEVKKSADGVTTIKAQVYWEGVKKWLLSQGDWVKVTGPYKYQKEMIAMIDEMRKMYEEKE